MDSWKPTAISIHFDNLCREPVGNRPSSAQTFAFSSVADWNGGDMQYFETRKPVETMNDLLEAVALLHQASGRA